MDESRSVLFLSPEHPFEGNGVMFRRIAAHDQYTIAML
jgi:hypothetical protein